MWLSGAFKSYEDPVVQRALEQAHAAKQRTVEVVVRGTAYVVELGTDPNKMVQVSQADPSRRRPVRRVA